MRLRWISLLCLPLAACGGSAPPLTPQEAHQQSLQRAFVICAGCHTSNAGGRSWTGPNLHGVVGRKAGSVPGFQYSQAMRQSNITWNEQTLDAFLRSPTQQVPGTRMVNATADPERRRLVIEYLMQQR